MPLMFESSSEEMRIAWAVLKWIEVARRERYGPEWLPSMTDAQKSGLLHRLLGCAECGRPPREPLPETPPLVDSYPVYPEDVSATTYEAIKAEQEARKLRWLAAGWKVSE